MLKEHLQNILFNNGKIVIQRVKKTYLEKLTFNDSSLWDSILLKTNFLSNSVTASERIYCILNDINSTVKCKECKIQKVTFITYYEGYHNFCSSSCGNKNKDTKKMMIQNSLRKHGVEYVGQLESEKEKKRKTSLERFGVDNYAKTDKFKQDLIKHNLEKYNSEYYLTSEIGIKHKKEKCLQEYGVDHFSKTSEYKEKMKKTSLERFGTEHPMKNSKVKAKVEQTTFERHGVTTIFRTEENKRKRLLALKHLSYETLIEKYKEKNILFEFDQLFTYDKYSDECVFPLYCTVCGSHFLGPLTTTNGDNLTRCFTCTPLNTSLSEKTILEYLSTLYQGEIKSCDRTILKPQELDLYIPEKKLAIEYNGLMFHSIGKSKYSIFNNSEGEYLSKKYHLVKTEGCERQDIQLLHIFENEWLDPTKQDVWKSIIQNKLGKTPYKHFARKTIVREVSNNETKQFLTENHLQGHVPSSINLGLYTKEGELLQIMTFGKSRYSKKTDYEMYRAASKKYTTIVGGSSKLFKYFVNHYLKTNESIVTYADRRYSQGKVYIELGFQFQGESEPNYFYFKEDNLLQLESRIKYQKYKLKELLKTYDSTLTESENMYNNGYRKIYDCGNLCFTYSKT